MKKAILFSSFIFIFVINTYLFAAEPTTEPILEPSDELVNKVRNSDLIIIGKPIKIEELERIEYQLSDFKLKTPVWKCRKVGGVPEEGEISESDLSSVAKDKTAKWICCGEKMVLEIQDDGRDSTVNSKSTSNCLTFTSATGYLTGKTGRYYEFYLNGKKISEKEYMEHELRKMRSRPKSLKKEITVKIDRLIKGKETKAEIVIDYQRGHGEGQRSQPDNMYAFWEKNTGARVLFLRRKNGHYSLVAASAKQNATDIIIDEGRVTVKDEVKRMMMKEETDPNSSEKILVPVEIKTEQPEIISLDEYLKIINLAIQKL